VDQGPYSEADIRGDDQEMPLLFMQPGDSLLCSEEFPTYLYPQPDL